MDIDSTAQEILWKAIRIGDFENMRVAVATGADLNAVDDNGLTPLLRAAKNGSLDMVEYLASKGADVNAKDAYGSTALDRAETWDFPENLQYQDYEGDFLGYEIAPIRRLAECLVRYGMRRDSNIKHSSFGYYDEARSVVEAEPKTPLLFVRKLTGKSVLQMLHSRAIGRKNPRHTKA